MSLGKVSGYPGANRHEARKLGLCRSCTAFAMKPSLSSKSSEAERERLKPLERHGLIASAVE